MAKKPMFLEHLKSRFKMIVISLHLGLFVEVVQELLSETTVHELLHDKKKIYKKAYDEDEVENAVA